MVIVGGGVAGVAVAKSLDGACNVILVDQKDHFNNPYGTLRGFAEGTAATLVPYDQLFLHNGAFVQGKLQSVNSLDQTVEISSPEDTSFFLK